MVVVHWNASGDPSNCIVSHLHAVGSILVVDCLVVVVLVPQLVNVAVSDWLHEIDKEEARDGWEDESYPIAWEPLVNHTVSLPWREFIPQSLVVWSMWEWGLLLDKAWNVQVDADAKLWFDLETLDHLDELVLFLAHGRVLRPNFPQVLVDIVVKGLHN